MPSAAKILSWGLLGSLFLRCVAIPGGRDGSEPGTPEDGGSVVNDSGFTGGGGGVVNGAGGGGGGGSAGGLGGGGSAEVDGGPDADGGAVWNQAPIALLKICGSGAACTQCSTTVSLGSTKLEPDGTRLLKICGQDSYAPPLGTMPLPLYRFRLLAKPTSAAIIENDGLSTAQGIVDLYLDGVTTGIYRISLDVWDDENQRSVDPALLNVFVVP